MADVEFTVEAAGNNLEIFNQMNSALTKIEENTRKVIKSQDDQTKATAKLGDVVKGAKMVWTEFNAALMVVQRGLQAVQQIIDATTGEFVKYANTVRTLTQINGEAAEANSRLIQTLDDYKVASDDVLLAQKKLATQHETLNLPTLLKLADAYQKLNDGDERQLFLTQNLGKASQQWAEVLTQSKDAIVAKYNAVEKGLILDQRALDEARNYEIQIDKLNDSVTALKVAAGKEGIPILINLVMSLSNGMEAWQTGTMQELLRFPSLLEDSIRKRPVVAFLLGMQPWQHDNISGAAGLVAQQWELEATAIEKVNAEMDALNQTGYRAADIWLRAQENVGSATKGVVNYKDALSATGTVTDSWARGLLEAKIASDGTFSPDTIMKIADTERALGMIDATTFNAFQKAIWLKQTLENLPDNVSTDVLINIFTAYQSGGNPNYAYSGTGGSSSSSSSSSNGSSAYWIPDPANPGHYIVNPKFKSGGGEVFPGEGAWVGDAPGGIMTPYTEYVQANPGGGFTVYNRAQMAGKSAPALADGGTVSPSSSGAGVHYNYGNVTYQIGSAQPDDWLRATRGA